MLNEEAARGLVQCQSTLSRFVEITDEVGTVMSVITFAEAAGFQG
jgi:hypothetical protein